MAKIKDRIVKAAREKQKVIYKGNPIRLSADFSAETLQTRREWHDIYIKSDQREKPTAKNTLHGKAFIQI